MEVFQWITLGFLVINGIGMPVVIWNMNRAGTDRQAKFEALHKRLDHLDECVDGVSSLVMSKGVTRDDLLGFKAEITDIINRQRAAISVETNGLHDRIMRLETPYFKRDG